MQGAEDLAATRETPSATPGSGFHRDLSEESAALARAERVRALGERPHLDLEAIVAALDDPDALVRGSAVVSLLESDAEQVLASLEKTWSTRRMDGAEATPELRILEYELIARIPMKHQTIPSSGQTPCATALGERDALVRSRGVVACLEAGEPDGDWIATAARDDAWAVRARLARALRRSSSEEAELRASILARLARDEHPTVRRAASGATSANPI